VILIDANSVIGLVVFFAVLAVIIWATRRFVR